MPDSPKVNLKQTWLIIVLTPTTLMYWSLN